LAITLTACQGDDHQESAGSLSRSASEVIPPAKESTDPPVDIGAPISVPVATTAEVTPTPIERLQQRLAAMPRDELGILQGTVTSLSAAVRTFPANLDSESPVGTTANIRVDRWICGPPASAPSSDQSVPVVYLAGTTSTGETAYTSLMPRDLDIGTDYVFVLRAMDSELFLTMGLEDVHFPQASGDVLLRGAGVVSVDAIKQAVCP
jgi:hypothetical protein